MVTAEQVQAIAAVATFAAATVAVWASFRAPRLAAKFAEQLRSETQREQESRSQKMFVFATLMQFRAQMANPNAVAALNLIDVVFRDAPEVREAWRNFHAATCEKDPDASARARERYLQIIAAIARNLAISDSITIADIQTSYYPDALAQVDVAAFYETQEKLKRFGPPARSPSPRKNTEADASSPSRKSGTNRRPA